MFEQLMSVVTNDDVDALMTLLLQGADLSMENKAGYTAGKLAHERHKTKCCKLLLKLGLYIPHRRASRPNEVRALIAMPTMSPSPTHTPTMSPHPHTHTDPSNKQINKQINKLVDYLVLLAETACSGADRKLHAHTLSRTYTPLSRTYTRLVSRTLTYTPPFSHTYTPPPHSLCWTMVGATRSQQAVTARRR